MSPKRKFHGGRESGWEGRRLGSGRRRRRKWSGKGRREDVSCRRLRANGSINTALVDSADQTRTAFVGMVQVVTSACDSTLINRATKGRVARRPRRGLKCRPEDRRRGGWGKCHAFDSSTLDANVTGTAYRRPTRGGTTFHGTVSIPSTSFRFLLLSFDRFCCRGRHTSNLCNGGSEKASIEVRWTLDGQPKRE